GRQDRVGGERRGRHPLFLAELVAEERQRAEARAAGSERNLEQLVPWFPRSDTGDLAARADEHAAGGAGRLDGRLDDHAQELAGIVGRRERLTEAGERFPEARPLGLELLEARLELGGHLVERPAEDGELVATANAHPLVELS